MRHVNPLTSHQRKQAPISRPGLDRERILAAGLDIADREGIDALTMRRLAAELDVEAASLYRYVESKDDLLNGVTDLVFSQVHVPPPDDRPWDRRLRMYLDAVRDTLRAHPNVLPEVARRPIMNASTLVIMEQGLGELIDLGIAPETAGWTIDILVNFIVGHVLAELSHDTGTDPEALAEARSLLPEDLFPSVRAAFGQGPMRRDEQFEFAVEVLIAGLAAQFGSLDAID